MTTNQPSTWQKRIEGEWHGLPSVFDAQGNHLGYNKVYRSSVFKDGQTTYYMDCTWDIRGELAPRLDFAKFAFGVLDSDQSRVYMGPDFIGAGHPYGAFVDAHYYSPAWTADLHTMNHVLPDGKTQVYSSMLFDGPTICAVFNGLYRVAFDYHDNPETKKEIDAYVEGERHNGIKQHVLPAKLSGAWDGEMEVYDTAQKLVGMNKVHIDYTPQTLLRAEMKVTLSGVINKQFSYVRYRNGNRHTYEGPDVFGNSMGYGRALFISQHFFGEPLKLKGREFLIDDNYTIAPMWQFFRHDRMEYMTFGVLNWAPGQDVFAK